MATIGGGKCNKIVGCAKPIKEIKMKFLIKMLSGLWSLFWILFSISVTFPIWIMISAYDLGYPRDDKDRCNSFFNKIWAIGGVRC